MHAGFSEKDSSEGYAIVEHQSKVHYDMAFKILRFMVMILTDYEHEQEKLKKGSTNYRTT